MDKNCFTLIVLLFAIALNLELFGQDWLTLEDQTASRLTLLTVPEDDGEEKDIAVSDLDKDGWTDIIVVRKVQFSNPGGRADLLLMNMNGVLIDMTEQLAPEFISSPSDARDVFIMDLNNDQWEDVFIATTFGQQPKVYANLGEDGQGDWLGLADSSANWLPTITVDPLQFCAVWGGDVTGNNAPDIYLSNYQPGGTALDVLLINDGNGHFTDESVARLGNLRNSAFGTSVEIHDVDNDNDNDIIKSSTLNSIPPWNTRGIFTLYNTGSGNFSNWQKVPSTAPYMFTIGDFTQNNFLDVYVVDDNQDYVNLATAVNPDVSVTYTNNVLANSPRTANFGGNVKLADLDNDTDLDVGVADVDVDIPPCESGASLRKFTLLRNENIASGDLTDPWGVTENPWNVSTFDFAFLDIDKNGKMDIFQANCSGYTIFMQPGETVQIENNYAQGWNLVSLPIATEDSSYQTLFPDVQNATLFGWNGSYFPATHLTRGAGYWLNFINGGNVTFEGASLQNVTVDLMEGWNLFAGPSCDVNLADIDDPGSIISPGTIFGYNGSYFSPTSISAGYGYWVKANADGQIILDCNASKLGKTNIAANTIPGINLPELPVLVFENGSGFKQSLYYNIKLDKAVNRNSFSLPPLIPGIAFDVRFSGNSRLTEAEEDVIYLDSRKHPVKITPQNLPVINSKTNYTIVIEEILGSKTLKTHELKNNESIVLLNPRVKQLKIKKLDSLIPTRFVVEQNYPNPFNPQTEIQYELPEKSSLSIIIYNTMGQKIKTLVSEVQEAGNYRVSWDATDEAGQKVAAGIYLYRVTTGSQSISKKMILLK